MQVVTDVEACANNKVNEALSSVLESEVKTQRIVKSVKIAWKYVPCLDGDISPGITICPGCKGIEWQPTGCIV